MRNAFFALVATAVLGACNSENINREALVERNNPVISGFDSLASLTVGNGGFAMTVDFTGLQTFPELYSNGVPLGTQSDWGWHKNANPDDLKFEETLCEEDMGHGHAEFYSRQLKDSARGTAASNWYRVNPHRLHLGCVGLGLDGANLSDFSDVKSKLDMMVGKIESSFRYADEKFIVKTVCHPDRDLISTEVTSDGTTPLTLRFPYPTSAHCDDACNWQNPDAHSTEIVSTTEYSALLKRTIDETVYFVHVSWEGKAVFSAAEKPHLFLLTPAEPGQPLAMTVLFSENEKADKLPSFVETAAASELSWRKFWNDGAAVDFSHCKDPRAKELERRVVLSQYLLAAQCAGKTPPQETGLTYNSWFGKFHLEMIYWHQAWLPLWKHSDKLKRTLAWYHKAEPNARKIAERQGFKGVRWMKMTDPSSIEAPSNVGSYLIWQQPHIILLSEYVYRQSADKKFLQDMAPLIEETAEFMADFATWNSDKQRYDIRGFIPAQETLRAKEVVNAPFELSYWHFGLSVAQKWRERQGLPRDAKWDKIIESLAPLAFNEDSLYLAAETAVDTYKDIRFTSDHPAVLGAVGILPLTPQTQMPVMRKTLEWVRDNWNWNKTWGWDYPMTAMCATRLGMPEMAVETILLDKRTNTYLPNGHNFQDQRLRCYLPGNGGLLTAVALMCAGWDGCQVKNPGFPKDGSWDVRWEGLQPQP